MGKMLLVLLGGISIGYFYGFSDAKVHKDNLVQRSVSWANHATEQYQSNDVDRVMGRLDKR